MKIKYYIKNVDLNIGKILESGQNILYDKDENIYSFIFHDKKIFCYTKDDISYFSVDEKYFNENLYNFFDLDTDYLKIRNEINEKFPELKRYTEYGRGIRFLSQDFLQVAVTFIFSQNNNIKRILNSVQQLKDNFGNGNFPTLEIMKKISIEEFRSIGIGFRDKYIYNFIQKIDEKWIEDIKKMSTKDAFEELNSFVGIGPKVANCILLFGLNKRDVFPVDVHIKRIMQEIYFDNKEMSVLEIEKFALKKYGNLSSYVQQYLFYWQISNK